MVSPKTPKEIALRLLAQREHTALELTRKLQAKQFTSEEIQEVLRDLTTTNALNHTRFVESYIYSRQQQGMGPLRIHQELITHGIPEDLIEHHLNITDNVWFTEAHRVWQKRFKGTPPLDVKTHAKQMRFLQSRGFTEEQINTILPSDNDS